MFNINKQFKLKVIKLNPHVGELHLSLRKLAVGVFILLVAALGTYFLWFSSATVPVVASLQVEQLTLPTGASVMSDGTASGGQAVQFTANGSATGVVSLSSGTTATSLSVTAKAKSCHGWPSLGVIVDGKTVLATTTISVSSWTTYTVTTNLGSGSHTIGLQTSNLSYKGNCSRVLYADVVTLYGPTTPAPIVSLSASPTSVTAGGSSTLTWSSTNATSCTASTAFSSTQSTSGSWSGSQPMTGSYVVTGLQSSPTYILTCSGSGGSGSASVVVGVTTSTTTGGTLTFNGDFANGTKAWNSIQCQPYIGSYNQRWRGTFYAPGQGPNPATWQGYPSGLLDDTLDQDPVTYPIENCDMLAEGQSPVVLPSEQFIGLSVWIPANFSIPNSSGRVNIGEWHYGMGTPQPAVCLFLYKDHVLTQINTGSYSTTTGYQYNSISGNGGLSPQYAVPTGKLTLGAWNDIVLDVNWAADSSGYTKAYYHTPGGAWQNGSSVSGIPTVSWNSGSAIGTTYYDNFPSNYGAYMTQDFPLYYRKAVIGTNLSVVQAAMP